jgi:hypothetical protein
MMGTPTAYVSKLNGGTELPHQSACQESYGAKGGKVIEHEGFIT